MIELLVVVAIAAAMAGLVITPMASWFSGVKTRAEVAEIHASVQFQIKIALLKAQALTIRAGPSAEGAFALPLGWRLANGEVEVTRMGYCKGGSLGFETQLSTMQVRVTPGTCSVVTINASLKPS